MPVATAAQKLDAQFAQFDNRLPDARDAHASPARSCSVRLIVPSETEPARVTSPAPDKGLTHCSNKSQERRVRFAEQVEVFELPPRDLRECSLPSPYEWAILQAAWSEQHFFALRNDAASATLLAASTGLTYLAVNLDGLPARAASALAAAAVGLVWTRTRPDASYRAGLRLLANGKLRAAENAFGWAAHSDAAKLGLAEARHRQGNVEAARVALQRIVDKDVVHG